MLNKFTSISVNLEDRKRWEKLTEDIKLSIFFSWEYLNAISSNYPNGIKLIKIENNQGGLVVVCSSKSKDNKVWDIFSPYGMDGIHYWGNNSSDSTLALQEYLRNNGIVTYYLYSHPLNSKYNPPFIEPGRSVYLLNIDVTVEEIWKNMHSNHKYEINKFNKGDFEIIEDKTILVSEFISLYKETLTRVNASSVYDFSSEILQKLFNLEKSFALGVQIDKKIESIVLFLVWGDCAEYYINASSEIGRLATRSLIWEVIGRLKSMGISKINLGGGVYEGDNLDNFKRRFGGTKECLGICKGVAATKEYERLCREANVSLDKDNYFPPYWMKKND